MSFYGFQPYVPVAARRRKAEKAVARMKKKGTPVAPVVIEGRSIARTFWGKAWCDNLERYSDYANRLPRGRTYVRNGSVIDLQIGRGEVTAAVMGSDLYQIRIGITAVSAARWKAICSDSSGSIDSLVELLQGKLAKGVMDRVCRQRDGLFPAPAEIKLSCSCPDGAYMCKHVAAVLYGVGARLDQRPELLFALRGVDEKDLVAGADSKIPVAKTPTSKRKMLADGDLASVFGLDMADTAEPAEPAPDMRKPSKTRAGTKGPRKPAAKSTKKTVTKRVKTTIAKVSAKPSARKRASRAEPGGTRGKTAASRKSAPAKRATGRKAS
ncbi:MAG: SWIM zinc finger family protein [Hyphomicrobium sp.]